MYYQYQQSKAAVLSQHNLHMLSSNNISTITLAIKYYCLGILFSVPTLLELLQVPMNFLITGRHPFCHPTKYQHQAPKM